MDNSLVKPKKFKPKKGFIPDIRIVNVLLVNDEGQVVLFKRSEDNEYFPGHFHILSGKLKKNENFRDCVIREILEETGIDISDEDISQIGEDWYTKWDGKTWKTRPFDVLIHNSKIVLNGEHSEYVLVNPLEKGDLSITPQVKEMFEMYAKYLGLDKRGLRRIKRAHKEYKKGNYTVLKNKKEIREYFTSLMDES
jgi:8-oxo-dGTP pyrophosphatase MutT (NUDIX family)